MLKAFTLAVLFSVVVMSAQCSATQNTGVSTALKTELEQGRSIFIVAIPPGTQKPPKETWFVYRDGAVYIIAIATDPRARAIQAGNSQATVNVGTPDGSALSATGVIVKDAKAYEPALKDFEKKYPEMWKEYGGVLRYNIGRGASVVIKYTPKNS